MTNLLILGGTYQARECAQTLLTHGFTVTSSLAGRVAEPRLPAGEVRIGGFGGPTGMAQWLHENRIAAVVDATHPFAERIGPSAVTACGSAGVPLVRLYRPGWQPEAGDRWHWVESLDAAARVTARLADRAFVTTGRQGLGAFTVLTRTWLLIRCVDSPAPPLPPHHRVILSRGPYEVADERALMLRHDIDALVTKDSGGSLTRGKLTAARELGLPVVIVSRPQRPETPSVASTAEAVQWITDHVSGGS